MKTLQDLLSMEIEGVSPMTGKRVQYPPSFRVSIQNKSADGVHIIIHADGHNSDTLDFIVTGNDLTPLYLSDDND